MPGIISNESNLKVATGSTRFLNFVIDTVGFLFIIFLNAMILDKWLGIIPPDGSPWLGVYFFALYFLYHALLELFFGKTIGEFFTGTTVLTANGGRPKVKVIILRNLCRLIPFDAISFLFSSNWHDDLSGTKVFYDAQ